MNGLTGVAGAVSAVQRGVLLAADATANAHAGAGEQVTFWIIATMMFVGALGVVLSRNAVHSALLLAGVMVGFAIFYAVNQAPFLAFVQVIVYTGAVMMLFLFVLMLVGVDASDSLVETIRGHRVASVLCGVALVVALLTGLAGAFVGMSTAGHSLASSGAGDVDNVHAIGVLLFNSYVWPFEITSALLITAAIGAMVLAHRERLEPRPSQREMSRRRFAGGDPSPLPGPGVFARHNSVDTPALLPDGRVAPGSVSHVILEHGTAATPGSRPGGQPAVGAATVDVADGATATDDDREGARS